jgi:uncharacterized membrane protein
MIKKMIFIYGHICFLLIIVLSISAPCLEAGRYKSYAKIIYTPLRVLCHQMPSRSIFLLGHKMGLCSRCFAIYSSFLLSAILIFLLRKYFTCYHWKIATIISIPMAIDGISQFAGLRESTNFLRIITGGLFGIGLAMLIIPVAMEICLDDFKLLMDDK